MNEQPLPKLPPEFGDPCPEWWTDVYGPTQQGDPIHPEWVDTDPRV